MNMTTGIRERVRRWMPLEDLLPHRLPAFVRSPAYFFGVISLSSLVLLILTGILLAAFGPQWWHNTGVGHYSLGVHRLIWREYYRDVRNIGTAHDVHAEHTVEGASPGLKR